MKNYKKHIEWNYNELKKHLNAYYELKDQEDLHKLRVHIKKIRSLVLWCKNDELTKIKTDLKKLKLIYEEAGKIRSGIIFIKLMNEYHIKAKQIINEEEKKRKLNTRLFDIHYWLYKKEIDTSWNKIQKHIIEPSPTHILKNIKKTAKSIQLNLSEHKTTENWHEARKEIKTILYNTEALKTIIKINVNIDTVYLQNLQHQLGEWHDIEVTEELLKMYISHSDKRLKLLRSRKTTIETEIKNCSSEFTKKLMYAN